MLLSPYGRVDVVHDRFKRATESGAGASALTYFDESETSVQAALGLRAESRHETSFGAARPRLRVELSTISTTGAMRALPMPIFRQVRSSR